jgi:hypothetical protein
MPDSTDKPISYERALWNHVWSDFKKGFGEKFRLVAEALVVAAVTYAVYLLFGKQSEVKEFQPEMILVLFAVPLAWLALHGVWSFATASRAIYYETQDALKIARGNAVPSLESIRWQARHEEAKSRLEHVRKAITETANEAPIGGYQYSAHAASTWVATTRSLLTTTLSDEMVAKFNETVKINPPSEQALDYCVAALKTIAAVLKTADLRD